MKILAAMILLSSLLYGCSDAIPDLKSPCVGAEGSPCDRRAPAAQLPS